MNSAITYEAWMWIDAECCILRELRDELWYGGRAKKLKGYVTYNIKFSVGQSEIVQELIK